MKIISPPSSVKTVWQTLYRIVENFIDDEALSRGAAIAFYATTALVPVLFIVVSIAGSLFGEIAARGALESDMQRLIGPQVADLLQAAIKNAAYTSEGFLANAASVAMLIVIASGVFGEMRAAPRNTPCASSSRPRVVVFDAMGTLLDQTPVRERFVAPGAPPAAEKRIEHKVVERVMARQRRRAVPRRVFLVGVEERPVFGDAHFGFGGASFQSAGPCPASRGLAARATSFLNLLNSASTAPGSALSPLLEIAERIFFTAASCSDSS